MEAVEEASSRKLPSTIVLVMLTAQINVSFAPRDEVACSLLGLVEIDWRHRSPAGSNIARLRRSSFSAEIDPSCAHIARLRWFVPVPTSHAFVGLLTFTKVLDSRRNVTTCELKAF